MPPPLFTTVNELLSHIALQIAPNGNEEITGQKHQDVLVTLVNSLLTIVNGLPGQTVNDFPAWESGTTYTGGVEVVVKHNGSLWLFISGSNNVGTEPGTNGLVWQQINAVQLAHFRNRDQYLDQGGSNEVSALQLKRLLALRQSWGPPVDDVATEPAGGEPIGYAYRVQETGTGDFAGHDGDRAELTITGWSFQAAATGDASYIINQEAIAVWTGLELKVLLISDLLTTPTLEQVLGQNTETGAYSIELDTPTTDGLAQLNHNSAGTVALPLDSAPMVLVNIAADAEIGKVSTSGRYGLRHITLVGSGSTHALTWASGWYKQAGVTLPSSIDAGQALLLTVRTHFGIGDIILTCEEVVTA